jgi:hypothetical protein
LLAFACVIFGFVVFDRGPFSTFSFSLGKGWWGGDLSYEWPDWKFGVLLRYRNCSWTRIFRGRNAWRQLQLGPASVARTARKNGADMID